VESLEERLSRGLRLATVNRLLAKLLLRESSSVGVKTEHNLLVAERVLLLDVGALGAGLTLGAAEDGLDFRRVDEAGEVGVGDEVGGEDEVLLEGRRRARGAVDGVEGLEGRGGPDDEATEVTTGGELEEVEGEDRGRLNTRDVAESTDELLAVGLGVVDDERAAALAEAAASQLTLTGTHLAGLGDLDELGTSTNSLEESDGSLGLGDSGVLEGLGVNDEGNLGDVGDAVAAGEEERGDGRGSEGRGGSETSISRVSNYYSISPLIHPYLWPTLTLWCHFLQTLVGANMRPERHWLPNAA
jgi:hypothetical protein